MVEVIKRLRASHQMVIDRSEIVGLGYSFLIFTSERSIMTETQRLIRLLLNFRDDRDWDQFHNAKDLAVALNIESAELLELFLWKNPEEADKKRVAEELADVLAYALLIAEKYGLDVSEIVTEKVKRNGEKYPVNKARGSAKKYDEL
nr:nucleotide pyrophosphohydrolase [Neolewinella litorea]